MIKIKDTSVVVSSRVRLARNIENFFFSPIIRNTVKELEILEYAKRFFDNYGKFDFLRISEFDELKIQSLVESYRISPILAKSPNGAVAVSDDESIYVMINEEDHVREQCILRGLDLVGAYGRLGRLDRCMNTNLRFCKNGNFYFTSCPTNLGTGMRASVMMFLPALTLTSEIDEIIFNAKRSGITFRGAMGEGSAAQGYWYQVSNSYTLGDCQDILSKVESFCLELCDRENDVRYEIYQRDKLGFEDRAFRAIGTLKYAKKLSLNECLQHIADVKLGSALEVFSLKNASALDDLAVTIKSATLRSVMGYGASEDALRAQYVNKAIGLIEN